MQTKAPNVHKQLQKAQHKLRKAEAAQRKAERWVNHYQQKVNELTYLCRCVNQPSLWPGDAGGTARTPELFS